MGKIAKQNKQIDEVSTTKHPLKLVYLLLAMLLFGLMYGQSLSGDVWWHLKTGQWIVQNRSLPFNDPFSYTARNPIILHEWGAEVVEWLIFSKISPTALAVFSVLLVSASFLFAFWMSMRRSRHAFASFLVVAVGAAASVISSEMRPQIFSFIFFCLTLYILQQYHERGSRIIWILPPLMLVWINFHGLFLIGFILIAMEAVIALITPPKWTHGLQRSRFTASGQLAAVGIVSCLFTVANPNGISPYLYPFHVMSHPQATTITTEWTSPNFHLWFGRALMAFMALAAIGLATMRKRPLFRDFVYVVVFLAATLQSQRIAVLFVIACAAPISLWLSAAQDEAASWLTKLKIKKLASGTAWGILTAIVLVLSIWRISDARGHTPFDYMICSDAFPSAACDFIQSFDISGPMFNDYNYGGYLIWRLWPDHRVVVDSRQEPFFNGSLEYTTAACDCAEPGAWQKVFNYYNINFAVVSPTMPLAAALYDNPKWVPVFADNKAVIFVRNSPQNAVVINAAPSSLRSQGR